MHSIPDMQEDGGEDLESLRRSDAVPCDDCLAVGDERQQSRGPLARQRADLGGREGARAREGGREGGRG